MSGSKTSKAKRFLVDQVVSQAKQEGVVLSELEVRMLGFSEAEATAEELEAAKRFEREVDDREYEVKISALLKHAYRSGKDRGEGAAWDDALSGLAERDAYLVVLAERAGIWSSSPFSSLLDWRLVVGLLPTMCFVAAAVVVGVTPLGAWLFPNILLRCALFFILLIIPWIIGEIGEHKNVD